MFVNFHCQYFFNFLLKCDKCNSRISTCQLCLLTFTANILNFLLKCDQCYSQISTCQLTFYKSQHQKTYLRTCAPDENVDRPAHARSLISIFTGRILDSQGCSFCMRKMKTLIRFRKWAGCFQSSLGAHIRGYIFLRWGTCCCCCWPKCHRLVNIVNICLKIFFFFFLSCFFFFFFFFRLYFWKAKYQKIKVIMILN